MIVVSFGMEALCIEELCKLLNNVVFLLEEVNGSFLKCLSVIGFSV